MTLWAFGDSYAQQKDHRFWELNIPVNDQWLQQIANKLNTEHKNFAVGGSALAYTYHEFYNNKDNFEEGDCVILCLTNIDRRWFFDGGPSIGILHDVERLDFVTKEIKVAVKQYMMYLNENPGLEKTYLYLFLEFVNAITAKKKLNTIAFTCFECDYEIIKAKKDDYPNIYIVDGNLTQITINEFDHIDLFWETVIDDKRPNHLLASNHNILAKRTVDYIKNKTPIDIKNGFVEGLIGETFFKDEELQRRELFGITWHEGNT